LRRATATIEDGALKVVAPKSALQGETP
jgi:hypothetical protein